MQCIVKIHPYLLLFLCLAFRNKSAFFNDWRESCAVARLCLLPFCCENTSSMNIVFADRVIHNMMLLKSVWRKAAATHFTRPFVGVISNTLNRFSAPPSTTSASLSPRIIPNDNRLSIVSIRPRSSLRFQEDFIIIFVLRIHRSLRLLH